MSILKANNLTYTYSKNSMLKVDAVKNVSFSVESGEIIGVVGHTGSGKSTLMQMLNGLITPDSGEVFFKGENIFIDKIKLREYRFKIGLVFQYPEYQIFEESCYKEIAFGPSNMGLEASEIDFRVRDSIKSVGLDETFLDKSPFDLSGGEKRRIAIASIIAMRPEILVLDEPTAGLDPQGKNDLLNLILDYRKTTNAAVIIVSHNMEDMAKVADKILVLKSGEALMFDTVNNVFDNLDVIESTGLMLPSVAKIIKKLKDQKILDCPNVYTVPAAKEAILSAIKERDKNA